MAQRFNFPREQVFSDLGAIGAGYKLHTYETGTTTPLATYSDTALSVANANPTIADSAGRFGDIFVDDLKLYKAILKDADDNTIYTADPVDPKVFSLADFDPRPTSFWGTTVGTADAFTLTADPDVSSYSSTQTFFFACHLDNNAGATLAVINSTETLSALTLKKYDGAGSKVDLEDGDLQAGQTYSARNDGTDIIILGKNPATTSNKGISLLPNPITVLNGTDTDHDIDFTAGVFQFNDGSGQSIASALTKQIDATWAAGDDAGGLADALTLAIDTTYHMFALSNEAGSSTDFGFDTSLTAVNLLADSAVISAGLTKYKRIASCITDGSSNILNGSYHFNPDGSYNFKFSNPINDVLDTNPGTSAQVNTMSTPTGLQVKWNGVFTMFDDSPDANTYGLMTSTQDANITPTFSSHHIFIPTIAGSANFVGSVCPPDIYTNTSSQTRYRISASTADHDVYLITTGWSEFNL